MGWFVLIFEFVEVEMCWLKFFVGVCEFGYVLIYVVLLCLWD